MANRGSVDATLGRLLSTTDNPRADPAMIDTPSCEPRPADCRSSGAIDILGVQARPVDEAIRSAPTGRGFRLVGAATVIDSWDVGREEVGHGG